MLTTFNDDLDLLKEVITDDESLVYGCAIETKDQSTHFDTIQTETEAVSDTKKCSPEVFRGREKNAGISVLEVGEEIFFHIKFCSTFET